MARVGEMNSETLVINLGSTVAANQRRARERISKKTDNDVHTLYNLIKNNVYRSANPTLKCDAWTIYISHYVNPLFSEALSK